MLQIKNEKINSFFALIVILFAIILSSVCSLSFTIFFTQIIFASFTVLFISKKPPLSQKIYLIIFLTSLTFVFLLYYSYILHYGNPYYIGGSDDLSFEQNAEIVKHYGLINPARVLKTGIIGQFNNSSFYAVYISLIMRLSEYFGGYSTLIPRIFNVYFLIWICLIFEYLLKKYASFSDAKTAISVAVLALTPNIQYINSHNFRDTLNLLQIFLIILLFDKIFSKGKVSLRLLYTLLIVLAIYITFFTRVNSLAFAFLLCLFMVSYKMNIKIIYIIIAALPLIIFGNILEVLRVQDYIDHYSNYVRNIAGDGLSSFIFNKPLIPVGFILRIIYAFMIPFPNFIGLFKTESKILIDFIMMFIYFGVIIQFLSIPFVVKRLLKIDWISLSFIATFLSVILSTFTFRHIVFYYPFMVAVAVDGFSASSKNQIKINLFYMISIALVSFLGYIALKKF